MVKGKHFLKGAVSRSRLFRNFEAVLKRPIVSEFRGGFEKAGRQSLKSNKVSVLYMATEGGKKMNVEHM